MKQTAELQNEIRANPDPSILYNWDSMPMSLSDFLIELIKSRGITSKEAIFRCNFDRSYGYQIINGTRTPTRRQLLTLALVLYLDEDMTQRLLKLGGRPVLYVRNRADAAVLYGLTHKLSLQETDELLQSLGEEGLL